MPVLPGGILRVFYSTIIATHPGALQFNSSVFELSAETQQSTTRIRTLKPDFVAFVNAAATSRSVFEFGIFLSGQIRGKDSPLFRLWRWSPPPLSAESNSSHYFPLPCGAASPARSLPPTSATLIICSHVDGVLHSIMTAKPLQLYVTLYCHASDFTVI
jgi:hypothetical protein